MLPDKKLHASGEDYLEAVLVLQKKKGMVRSVDVARYMEVSKPSVCHAVATLKAGGFLTMDEDFFLRLTDIGREVAEQTYEKHCFFTRLLVEAGVEPKTAEQEACCMVLLPPFSEDRAGTSQDKRQASSCGRRKS